MSKNLERNCPKCNKIILHKNKYNFQRALKINSSCKRCSVVGRKNKYKMASQEFIDRVKKIHNNKYDYSKMIYNGVDYKIEIVCKIHGSFWQTGVNHLYNKSGCYFCMIDNQRKSVNTFIDQSIKIHGKKYDYKLVEYVNANSKVDIICSSHGVFSQVAKSHIYGQGCPYCVCKGENKVSEILKDKFIGWKISRRKLIWKSYKNYKSRRICDFLIEKENIKIMVEYDGEQHFFPVKFGGISYLKARKSFEKQKIIDSLDEQFCKENDIYLHRIKYNEDIEKSIDDLSRNIDVYIEYFK